MCAPFSESDHQIRLQRIYSYPLVIKCDPKLLVWVNALLSRNIAEQLNVKA